ncbi:hypothetical protein [Streptomyces globisporus]
MYIIPFVAEAAEKKKDGFEYTEALGVTVASAVTVLGVVLAAWIAYRTGRRQVADQGLIEHKHWRRQNRLEAYKQFMVATDGVTDAFDKWRTTRSITDVGQAIERLMAAKAGVRLSGPISMTGHADKVTDAVGDFYTYLRQPNLSGVIPPMVWKQRLSDVFVAQNSFVIEAAKVLDNPDL